MRILYASAELTPLAATGGLGDVTAALPAALQEMGIEVARIIPFYRSVREAAAPAVEKFVCTVSLGRRRISAGVWQISTPDDVCTFAVDIPEYFDRRELYGTRGVDYKDAAERFIAFQKAVLAFATWLPKPPQVIHCNDWHTALIPVLIHAVRNGSIAGLRRLAEVRTILTIHNLAYQGVYPPDCFDLVGLPASYFNWKALEFYGMVNFLKGGIVFSDVITTVSPTYAREIQQPEFGCGLDGLLRERAGRLRGILNGVDYGVWHPSHDQHIPRNYDSSDLRGKAICKRALLKEMGLPQRKGHALLGIISRLVEQKGLDIIDKALESILRLPVQLILLGTGEPPFEDMCRKWALRHPQRIAVRIAFDQGLAHRIQAGSDIYLMPSRYEPCGLNQIYSLAYGTIPIVHDTGGLADTVVDIRVHPTAGTGFKFAPCCTDAFLDALHAAVAMYASQRRLWRAMVRRAMAQDFSWKRAAGEYAALYRTLIDGDHNT
ncbi:MAG TPA: glycogen synthase GlgA [Lentisphaerae bacterium]|nr:glycogen synthase GlgA [Lentisphaerota bacterium]